MRNSFRSRTAEPAAIVPALAAVSRVRTLWVPRPRFLALATFAAALVCAAHAAVAGANTVRMAEDKTRKHHVRDHLVRTAIQVEFRKLT